MTKAERARVRGSLIPASSWPPERPILFSAPMVRAILDDRKTQTRRVMTPQPRISEFGNPERPLCPYGLVSHSLWVREAWSHDAPSLEDCRIAFESGGEPMGPYYFATETAPDTLKWKPSIHMPRWASRINLLIKSIRVERLNDISEADAKAEGVEPFFAKFPSIARDQCMTTGERAIDCEHRASFACLWDDINGAESWKQNPWVWVVEFEVMK